VDDIFGQSDSKSSGTDQIIMQIISRIERERRRPQVHPHTSTQSLIEREREREREREDAPRYTLTPQP